MGEDARRPCEVMALRALPFTELFSLHAVLDEERRPLGEHRAPCPLPGAAPTQLRSCPYPGSRHEHALPMNLSALRQTTKHLDEVHSSLVALREWCGGRDAPLALGELWQLTAAAAVLPAFLLHRQRGVEVLDAGTAVLYKACLGIKFLIEQCALDELLARGVLDGERAAAELAEYSERSGWLVGRQEVCAATATMIDDVLRTMRHGQAQLRVASRLVEAMGSPEPFQAFTRASWELYALLLGYSTWSMWAAWPGRGAGGDEARLAVLTAEDPPPQNRLSLTMGMRRISVAFSGFDEVRCAALLEGFVAMVAGGSAEAAARGAVLAGERDAARAEAFVAREVRAIEERLNAALGRASEGRGTSGAERHVELPAAFLSAYRAPARSAR